MGEGEGELVVKSAEWMIKRTMGSRSGIWTRDRDAIGPVLDRDVVSPMRAYVGLRRVVVPRGARHLSIRCLSTASVSCRKHIESKNAVTNAMVFVSDAPAAPPKPGARLHGLPVAVKDNICTRDMPTTCSSAMLKSALQSVL